MEKKKILYFLQIFIYFMKFWKLSRISFIFVNFFVKLSYCNNCCEIFQKKFIIKYLINCYNNIVEQ
jgi:hypothetical protein